MFPPGLALLVIALLPAARADLIPCEQRATIALAPDEQHVQASFLGSCGEVEDYDQALAIQVETDDGWTIAGTHWEVTGSEDWEIDGEIVTYRVFEQQVACPGPGPWDFRVAWIDRDGVEPWTQDRFDCIGPAGCATTGGLTPVPWVALLALIIILPSRCRTRGT
jgi:hypothetical protein